MATNKFRYPPAPGHGGDTFSDNLVGIQLTDGSSQMTMGNFTTQPQNSTLISTPNQEISTFSSPITLDSLNIGDLELAKSTVKNNLEIFINTDTSDISNLVLYGSLKKRFSVATQNIINNFPAALYIDGIDANLNSGNITASDIVYSVSEDTTSFNVNVNFLSNPFDIEFTTNGNLLDTPISPQQILNNLNQFGQTATTITGIAEGKVVKTRNLTNEFQEYCLSFSGELGSHEFKVKEFTPQSVGTNLIKFKVEGKPFGDNTNVKTKFYIKPTLETSEKQFKTFLGVEKMLLNRDISPIYTSTFKMVKETTQGISYIDEIKKTWPLQDNVNLDITTVNYTNYLKSLADIGEELDNQKTNLISRFLTTDVLKEFDTSDQKVEKTLQVYGRNFDDIKTFVDGIAYMTNVTYDSKNNIPNELIKNFAQTLGFSTPTTLNNDKFLDGVLGVSTPLYSGSSLSKTPAELDIELYRRILLNISYLFKSKGARKSIEFLLELLGAPPALVEFNEYVVLADQRISTSKFENAWEPLKDGTYTTGMIKYSIPFQTFFTATATTAHPFNRQDYPIDADGYPTVPRTNNNYFFQRGAGWFERTETHTSDLIINQETSTVTGCSPTLKMKFREFTWGGFWTMGHFSNEFNAPYLDRFWRFPLMHFGFGLERIVDDKKSWVREEKNQYIIDEDFAVYHVDVVVDENGVATAVDTTVQEQIFKNNVAQMSCNALQERKELFFNKLTPLIQNGTNPLFQKQLQSKIEYVQHIQRIRCGTKAITRDYQFKERAAYYGVKDERLVLNVKNVDLSLNIGQALAYDVWQQSANYNCLFSGGSLPLNYPQKNGRWDATDPKLNAKTHNFKNFAKDFWKFFIDTKNRMTINDGKTGGYPTLQKIYVDYLEKKCGENNQYTYSKMLEYAQSLGDYWIRIVEQMVPSTTLWTSGVKVENSVFHRDKFVYRCYSMTGVTMPIIPSTVISAATTGYTSFPAPQFRTMAFTMPPPANPQRNTTYYSTIISGATPNPVSTYINNYNLNNRNVRFGSLIVSEEMRTLVNKFHSNKDKFSSFDLFTKQGSTHNFLSVYGFKDFGDEGLDWVDNYDLGGGINSSGPAPQRVGGGGGGGTQGGSNYGSTSSGGGMSSGGYGGGMSSGGGGGTSGGGGY